jgi:two-component system, chemotaxis family, protein-glutamate methylesterase/glutaminase
MNHVRGDSPVRVLIVDDSAFMRTALSRMVASDVDLVVVGTAASGEEALERIPVLDPEVITLDVQMPGLDGLETLRRIMSQFPRQVIMVSALTLKGAETTFNALDAGAFDYVPKQLSSTCLDIPHLRDELIAKIKAASISPCWQGLEVVAREAPPPVITATHEAPHSTPSIVAIGASTGGPQALQEILAGLPGDLHVPILVVQHMPSGFTAPFAQRLNSLCAVSVCEAAHGQEVQPGVVYIAPAGSHLLVNRTGSRTLICLSDKPGNQLHVPSVDVMMQSVASNFHSLAMGVILTGMGSDGAQGMNAIHCDGGFTLGQDEPSCAVYGMPRACAEMGTVSRVVPLSRISQEIMQATHYRKTSASSVDALKSKGFLSNTSRTLVNNVGMENGFAKYSPR